MKHRNVLVITAILSLSACATLPETSPVREIPERYKAHGTEPFWSLEASDGIMSFNDGNEVITRVMEYRATPISNGWRYVSKTVTADVEFTECSDGMSEFTYKDTVTVKAGGRTFQGCGGGIVPPETLEQTQWRILSINGEIIEPERDAKLSFDGKRMSGSIGCNRLGAEYSFKEKTLLVGPVMSTRMACPDPLGAQEYAVVTLLGALQSTDFPGDGTMVLKDKAGGILVLEQTM